MKKTQCRKLFEQYNPKSEVVRCPNGKVAIRKQLNIYAKAAVNLYGIIPLEEFVHIFNSHYNENLHSEDVFRILLPLVLKNEDYCFYKHYLVHNIVLNDFDWVLYLEQEQEDKPRYIPDKEEFFLFRNEYYINQFEWKQVREFMFREFGINNYILDAYRKLQQIMQNSLGMEAIEHVLKTYPLDFKNEESVHEFINLVIEAKNSTRLWENKGFSPNDLRMMEQHSTEKETKLHIRKEIKPYQKCPCGSKKKYGDCCGIHEQTIQSHLSAEEQRLFYNTWLKLMEYINWKEQRFPNYKFQYPNGNDEIVVHEIRNILWDNPNIIDRFLDYNLSLSSIERELLRSWKEKFIKGEFIIMEYVQEGAILMSFNMNVDRTFYLVKGILNSVAFTLQRKLPVIVSTILLPFQGKIIYDSFLAPYSVAFSNNMTASLQQDYKNKKNNSKIISSLE